jgi:hypothetical protein
LVAGFQFSVFRTPIQMLIGDGNVSDPVEHFVREMQQAYLPSESMFGWYILVVNLSYSSDETVSWLVFTTGV